MSKTVDWPHPCAGERNRSAKLTEEQALEIKRSREPLLVLAARYDVSVWTVWATKAGRRWGHLPESSQKTTRPTYWAKKLSDEDVFFIRSLLSTGKFLHRDIATRFGVSRAHITRISSGERRRYE